MAAAIAAGAIQVGCIRDRSVKYSKTTPSGNNPQKLTQSKFEEKLTELRQMPRDLVMLLLNKKVDHYMQLSHNCAQSGFLALQEQFGLGGDEVVKALTPLAGIAERGETCGAVTGPLMAYGLIYGRGKHQLEDWDAYRTSLVPSGKFCHAFEKAFGTTQCHEIQKKQFGRSYQLTDPKELTLFQEAGATENCSIVVRKAVRLAATIILDYKRELA